MLAEKLTELRWFITGTVAPHAAAWRRREPLDPVLVAPELVAEVDADTAIERGAYRYQLRLARLPLDVTGADVPRFGEVVQPGGYGDAGIRPLDGALDA